MIDRDLVAQSYNAVCSKGRGIPVKAVLLAGGLGTRLREETEYRPKPMVEVGGRPILWHIMKGFAHHGITDFVVCTGETHTVREFCEAAFARVGLDADDHVVVDERFYRPAEVDLLVGDGSRVADRLGCRPTMSFTELVETMVDADLALLEGRLDRLA